ncbi:MAG: glycosyltransferase family 2 protein [Gammaproteobacteria bacterium]
MPVYNGEQYLESAIDSVLAQTFDDFELIIADNASEDRSSDICQDYAARDPRIRYLRNETNIGAAANYNLLFAEARCDFFRWNNADDLLEPTLHERCWNALTSNPDAVLAAGTSVLIDSDGNETERYNDNLNILAERPSERLAMFFDQVGLTNVIYGLMRREPLGRTELMGDGSVPSADIVFMAHLVLQGKFVMLDEPLFYRRMHEQSSSSDRYDKEKQESFWSAGKAKLSRPAWKRVMAYRRAISKTAVPLKENLALYRILLGMIWANKRRLSTELINTGF